MSEFSESFHFADAEPDKVAKALETAGLNGVVWGPSDTGWVSFVPFDSCPGHAMLSSPGTDFAGKLSKIADKPVLIWLYAEDHCWYAILWRDGERVAAYGCDWNDDITVDATEGAVAEFQKLPMRAGMAAQIADALPAELDDDALLADQPNAYRFAEALGLAEYQWKSSQTLTMDTTQGENHEGLQVGKP